jgi:hypothetical protein
MNNVAKELDSESNSCLRKLTAAIELQAALELYQDGRLVEAAPRSRDFWQWTRRSIRLYCRY